jgi:hypothetical protein
MYVQNEETLEIMDTAQTIPQRGPVNGPFTEPVIGNGGFGGPLTSGQLGFQIGGVGAAYLVWKNEEELRAQWAMDSEDAVIEGLNSIMTALAGDETAIVLARNGSYYVAS